MLLLTHGLRSGQVRVLPVEKKAHTQKGQAWRAPRGVSASGTSFSHPAHSARCPALLKPPRPVPHGLPSPIHSVPSSKLAAGW